MSGRQLDFFELNYTPVNIDKPIRLIELFAGIGSQAKALKNINAPFEHYRVVEFDQHAINSYNAIHGTDFATQDITLLTDLEITNTDDYYYILTYSFPCQDLSVAGKGAGMARGGGTRSGLLWEVERLLCETKALPQCLLMENVLALLNEQNIKHFNAWQLSLGKLGYTNYVFVLSSKDFGIAQNRERVFMLSLLGRIYYKKPEGNIPSPSAKTLLEKQVDEKYYLKQRSWEELAKKINVQKNVGKAGYNIAGLDIEPNGLFDYSFLKNKEKKRVLNGGNLSPTLTTSPTHGVLILESTNRARRLTPKEYFRLMGFTDDDYFKAATVCSNIQLYKQAGNSIVVPVLEAIFKNLNIKEGDKR